MAAPFETPTPPATPDFAASLAQALQAAGVGGSGGTSGKNPTGAWFPRPLNNIFTDTSTPAGIARAEDPDTYFGVFSKADLEGALNDPQSQPELFAIVAAGRKHGSTANGVFQAYVAESARQLELGNRITPQQLALNEAQTNGWIDSSGKVAVSATGGSAGAYAGPTSQVTLTNETDAKALVDNAFGAYLGRNPNEDELANFWKMLRGEESSNPSTNTPGSGDAAHNRVVAGGVNEQQIATDFAKASPDYVHTQENTTAMNWLQEAITGAPTQELI